MNTIRKKTDKMPIRTLITISFSILMVIGMAFLGIVLYQAFSNRMLESMQDTSELLLQQAADYLEDYLYNTQEVVDTLNNQFADTLVLTEDAGDGRELKEAMKLLYQANRDNLVSIACYSEDGELLASVPYETPKESVDVTKTDWFVQAIRKPDESYMSAPHVQNLFDFKSFDYFWVVSLSRSVKMDTEEEGEDEETAQGDSQRDGKLVKNSTDTLEDSGKGNSEENVEESILGTNKETAVQDESESSNKADEKAREGIRKVVLLADMNYSSIGELFAQLNENSASTYTYLMGEDGTLIYHPNANLIFSNLFHENVEGALAHEDGSWGEVFEGEHRLVTAKTVGETGWRIVRVTSENSISLGMQSIRFFVIIIVIILLLVLSVTMLLVSSRITSPLSRLTDSIEVLSDDGLPEKIYVGGSYEVEYLGESLSDFVQRLRKLMEDIIKEQEEKRRSELDALQSQINPHFLYNTLDSIVWMIEGEQYQEAIFMIRQLASLFRISLSKGKTMISIDDELKHAENYMNIQKVRYKNRFEISYEIDPEIRQCITVKLILQPILENALYYAIEALDGDGEILVRGFRDGDDVYLQVMDNGMGMTREVVESLLLEDDIAENVSADDVGKKNTMNRVRRHGSGVGLKNVNKRLKIRFGEEYGLKIDSEPDEGTTVTVHLPYQLAESAKEDKKAAKEL